MPSGRRPDAVFSEHFLSDLAFWVEHEPRTAARVLKLVEGTLREPTRGIGKPERLQNVLGENVWSRRITQEHRLVYEIASDDIRFLQCRYHY
ncbi:MAG: Txe/YoeB family addiction module toxin [Longimicrobiales bacterium]